MAPENNRLRFGDFEFDPAAGELFHSGLPTKLAPQPARVLEILLAAQGRLVSREEIQLALWPDGTNVEFDQGLNYSIRQIRLALGESASEPQFIETLPKKGYRFIMPVETFSAPPPMVPPAPRRLWPLLLLPLAAILTFFLWYALRPASPPPPKTVLVRGFVPLGWLEHEAWYADAVVQQLISDLAATAPSPYTFRVLPWSATLSVRGLALSSPELGRRLQADAVLEGSLRQQSGRMILSAQMVETSTGNLLWSYRDERDGVDLGRVESSLAFALAQSLRLRLRSQDPSPARRRPSDPETFNLYLKAVSLGDQFSRQGITASLEAFQEVIRREPGFAPAYVGLANSLVIEPFTNQAPPLENLQRARQLATRALQMDPLYGEAHAVLAHAYFNLWSWPEAESEFRQALALEPNSAMTHQLYALFLASQDRFNEAIPSIQRAVNLAPTSPLISFSACRIHFHAQRYAEAARFCHETLLIDPARLQSFLLLSRIASLQNNLAQAQEHLSAWSSRRPSPLLSLWQAYYLAAAGESAAARALLARWEQTNSSPSPPPLPYGLAKLKLQDFSSGFAALEQSVQRHLPSSVWLKVTPELQPHRDHPRLQKIFAALHAPNPIPPAASPAASPTTSPNLAR